MKITFRGAAQTVTGSMHELEVQGKRYLLDCGLYQGRRKDAEARNRTFPFRARDVEAVVLSHAHIDHSGNLPTLFKNGFRGPIFATKPTVDLCDAMLQDSAYLQEKDAAFINKRSFRRRVVDPSAVNGEVKPLYTIEDAQAAIALFRPTAMHDRIAVGPGISYEASEAGHMLGSTFVRVHMESGGKSVRLLFSGDLGRVGLPIIRDPETAPEADYLILESTYGGRLHQELGQVAEKLADIVKRTAARGGKIIVPAFAVGRTQQLVVLLHELSNRGAIPAIPIFVDSPLAVNVTEVFRKHGEWLDDETRQLVADGSDAFGFKRLRYIRDVQESKALNDLHGPFIIISASGMCEAGRIVHHLRNNIEDPRNTVLITGFQAENTLGRKIVDKWPEVPIFGEAMRLRAEVTKLNELSGHADQSELLAWMKPLAGTVKKVFLVHGELDQAQALSKTIKERYGLEVHIPAPGDSHELA